MELTSNQHNALEDALSRAHEQPAMRPAFYRALLRSEIYLIGSSSPIDGDSAGRELTLMQWETEGGERIVPIFSSLDEVRRSIDSEEDVLRMPVAQLMALGTDVPLVLNPLSEMQEVLSPDDVQALAAGHLPGVTAVASRQFDVGAARNVCDPDPYPALLVDALTTLFSGRPQVMSAWVCAVDPDDEGRTDQLLIGLDLEPDTFDQIAEDVAYVASQVQDSGVYASADVMELGASPLSAQIRELGPPFYRRTWGERITDPLQPGHA